MAKKKLLSEAQVRRFMSLANIQPLSENMYVQEEEEEEVLPPIADDVPGEEFAGDDLPKEEPGEEAEVSMDDTLVDELEQAAATIQQVTDILTRGAKGEGEEELEGEMDLGAEEEEEVLPPVEDEEEVDELEEVQLELSEEEIVNEVARRVAKRIVEAKRAQKKMNEALGKRTPLRRRKPTRSRKLKGTPARRKKK